ncbi:MAG: hypothetical protein DRJ09_08740 [Bacteroidetes bacterium]|nr:MAG: hypothetical protein DRJ09_08740 [Bacteroidota bacterium]
MLLKNINFNFKIIKHRFTIVKLVLLAGILLLWLQAFTQTFRNNLESADSLHYWINTNNLDSTNTHSGNYAAFTDSVHPYGLGVEMLFPDSILGKNTILSIRGFVFSNTLQSNALYVVSIVNQGETAFWQGISLKKILKHKKIWTPFHDSVIIPASITKTGKLKIYLWNQGKKSRILVDDLAISFRPLHNPSFLKDVDTLPEYVTFTREQLIFENNFYQIWNKGEDGFFISDTSGKLMTNHIRYFYNQKSKGKDYQKFSLFKFVSIKNRGDKTFLTFKTKSEFETVKLLLRCNKNTPEIDLIVSHRYKKSVEVSRSALLLDYALPLQEVFRANRKSDVDDFQNEYWLDKQGFTLSNNSTALAIYHTPGISSLQLNTKSHLAVINLDYEKDHPFLRFPLDADTFDFKVDESTSLYQRGNKKKNSFKIFAGIKPEKLPRLMKNPDGFLATYIWTEHADWGDIRTHHAAYFGSEKITNADSAVGGFVKYNIPVTKSVFYDNPDSITNTAASDSLFTTFESAIKTDTAYAGFLKQIHNKGNEICLHTPEQFSTTPDRLDSALAYMKKYFNSPTWIDHGYNNLKSNNREDFVCDGSLNYTSSLWKKYGIRYFWNPYYEDYQTFVNWGFFGSVEKMFSGYGDFYPKPDYWQHPSRTNDFYHWPTASVLYIGRERLWNYFFSSYQMNLFTHDWGVEINHCYPAWTKPGKGFWKYSGNSTVVAMEGFNRTLALMQQLKLQESLNVTTVEAFLNYQLALEQVDYAVLPDGRVRITNPTADSIKGLSFAVKAKVVTINGLRPAQKQADENLIFWFDLSPGHSALIRMVE